MRATIYITSLLLVYVFTGLSGYSNWTMHFLTTLVTPLVLYRFLVLFGSRAFLLPESFRGIVFVITFVFASSSLIVAAGYALILIKVGSVGFSGVPLGIIVLGSGFVLMIPIIYCEIREIFSSITDSHLKSTIRP